MGETQRIRIISPDGSEDVIDIDQELYDRFAARAKELGVSEEKLFVAILDDFLKKQGY
jgi:hypothetical protein